VYPPTKTKTQKEIKLEAGRGKINNINKLFLKRPIALAGEGRRHTSLI
jgi:hypothetical protein